MKGLYWLFVLLSFNLSAQPIGVIDDLGRQVSLDAPAQRVVALAPHLIESLFTVGAGAQVVGAVEFSDYPKAAKQLPRVGGYSQINLEAVVGLNPDLIVAWHSGNNANLASQLAPLGIPVYYSEPRSFGSIADTLERMGVLTGHAEKARVAAEQFRVKLDRLKGENTDKLSLRVFFEVWADPLMTINGEHLISRAISLCGGENIFAEAQALVPRVGIEGVMAGDPQVIVSGDKTSLHGQGLDELQKRWRPWHTISAVANNRVYTVQGDLILRHSPRILLGVEQLCRRFDLVRAQLSSSSE